MPTLNDKPVELTPARYCKLVGFKSMKEVAHRAGRSKKALESWHSFQPSFFRIVVAGCLHDEYSDDPIDGGPAEYCVSQGFKELTEVMAILQRPRSTLERWRIDRPRFFRVVVAGCIEAKRRTLP